MSNIDKPLGHTRWNCNVHLALRVAIYYSYKKRIVL